MPAEQTGGATAGAYGRRVRVNVRGATKLTTSQQTVLLTTEAALALAEQLVASVRAVLADAADAP